MSRVRKQTRKLSGEGGNDPAQWIQFLKMVFKKPSLIPLFPCPTVGPMFQHVLLVPFQRIYCNSEHPMTTAPASINFGLANFSSLPTGSSSGLSKSHFPQISLKDLSRRELPNRLPQDNVNGLYFCCLI